MKVIELHKIHDDFVIHKTFMKPYCCKNKSAIDTTSYHLYIILIILTLR